MGHGNAHLLVGVLSLLQAASSRDPSSGHAATPRDPFDPATWHAYLDRTRHILTMPPNGLRNLQITQTYHEIGLLFQQLTRTSPQANWPSIATWASNTVGMGIRKTMLPHWVDEVLEGWPVWVRKALKLDADLLDKVFDRLLNTTSLALSGGNALVFDEIGTAFSRFGVYFANASLTPAPTRLEALLATFPPASPLRQALTFYYRAMHEPANATQLVYYANAIVGLDEQTKLQPFIYTAFLSNVSVHILGRSVTLNFSAPMTRLLMSLIMPGEVLFMGRDLPPRPMDGRAWSVGLDNLSLPGLLPYYLQFAPSATSLAHTAATDWVPLAQRMRYVWPMFRSRQDNSQNDCPPFNSSQVEMIFEGFPPAEESLCLPYDLQRCCGG